MPSGHASHKGYSVKPNTNAEGRLDTAADTEVEPQDILGERANATRDGEETVVNPAATERPKNPS
ncbi:hypothetical protein [Kamptonema formosum]|uniref:hypothetical protein n=1 Tax=Kamptonema formosum TaxID=331992 RepID=UPI0003486472|nr:hypothetical protein [Oscillatoria sp. PCC 10802]